MKKVFSAALLISIIGCQSNESLKTDTPPNVLMICIDDLNDWLGV
jgi:hypothetical protein